uniref:Protein kinase domain-containing protein n=1 Tax=Quercus lobata TaxID=97700 RepID=A0A7N2L6X3_QUELO
MGPSGGFNLDPQHENDIHGDAHSLPKGLQLTRDSGYKNNTYSVGLEFDTYKNWWDPRDNHVGIDVNSIDSSVTFSQVNFRPAASSLVRYNSTTKNLSVFLTPSAENLDLNWNYILSFIVDLRTVLPEWVNVGFSAATVSLVAVMSCGLVLLWFICWRKKESGRMEEFIDDMCMGDEICAGTVPRRFTYLELSRATNNFVEEGKLGEGGFGGVYKGLLCESNTKVAVKVSKESKQGKNEYISKVNTITHLRHRNLVQLIGWCHKRNEFLLVYEYMPNGSLDSHLFGAKITLTWPMSFGVVFLEIACGRKPIEPQAEPNKLACCHPDPSIRPSIRQVMHALNFEAPFPKLPSKLPMPMYFGPPLHVTLTPQTC